jgi:zinc D-Ala-D-Ala carboxypeptidase
MRTLLRLLCKKLKGSRFTQLQPKNHNLDLKYFTLSEFDSPDETGSGSKMDKKFLEKLDYARGNAGVPFKINSGYRTKSWNLKVGGRVGSSHQYGIACDIHCNGSRDRALIIKALMEVGITRIGIAKTFVHCDVDKKKSQDVFWLYN